MALPRARLGSTRGGELRGPPLLAPFQQRAAARLGIGEARLLVVGTDLARGFDEVETQPITGFHLIAPHNRTSVRLEGTCRLWRG